MRTKPVTVPLDEAIRIVQKTPTPPWSEPSTLRDAICDALRAAAKEAANGVKGPMDGFAFNSEADAYVIGSDADGVETHPDLHAQIMNLPCDAEGRLQQHSPTELFAYRLGHRDARHAAAELAAALGVQTPRIEFEAAWEQIKDRHPEARDAKDFVRLGWELCLAMRGDACGVSREPQR